MTLVLLAKWELPILITEHSFAEEIKGVKNSVLDPKPFEFQWERTMHFLKGEITIPGKTGIDTKEWLFFAYSARLPDIAGGLGAETPSSQVAGPGLDPGRELDHRWHNQECACCNWNENARSCAPRQRLKVLRAVTEALCSQRGK